MNVSPTYEKYLVAIERHALPVAFVVTLGFAIAVLGLVGTLAISDVADIRGTEPHSVFGIQKIMTGHPLYTPPTQPPFDTTCYSPLYYMASAALAKQLGIVPGDVYHVTLVGRILSATATLLLLVTTFLFLRYRLKIGIAVSGIACCLLLVFQAPWNVVVRPDAMASLLGCCSLYCAIAALRRNTHKGVSLLLLMVAMALGIAAAFTKQNVAVFPATIILLLFLRKDWLRFSLSAIVAAAIMGVLLTPRISGDLFLRSILGIGAIASGGVDLGNVYAKVLTPLLMQMNLPILFAIGFALVLAWGRPGAPAQKQLLALTFLALFATAAVTSLKLGSTYHYFNDTVTVAVVATAYALAHIRRDPNVNIQTLHWRPVAAAFVVMVLPVYSLQLWHQYRSMPDRIHMRAEAAAYLKKALDNEPNVLFFTSDNTLANFFPDRVTVPNLHTAILQRTQGRADFAPLQERIQTSGVGYCALEIGQTPKQQLAPLGVPGDRFSFVENIGGFSIWRYIPQTVPIPPVEPALPPTKTGDSAPAPVAPITPPSPPASTALSPESSTAIAEAPETTPEAST